MDNKKIEELFLKYSAEISETSTTLKHIYSEVSELKKDVKDMSVDLSELKYLSSWKEKIELQISENSKKIDVIKDDFDIKINELKKEKHAESYKTIDRFKLAIIGAVGTAAGGGIVAVIMSVVNKSGV